MRVTTMLVLMYSPSYENSVGLLDGWKILAFWKLAQVCMVHELGTWVPM